jgi:guanosine-3',5'-bis(diphosphate) 3'-pyrophosphohydrolase
MNDINSWESKFKTCHYSERLINKLCSLNPIINNSIDIHEVKKAIYYAKKYHEGQKRQSGEPFYSHPLEVAYMFAQYTIEENQKYFTTDLLVTSVLHDTIEDTKLTFEVIKIIFGKVIAVQVMDLTRIKENGHKISSSEILELLWMQKKYNLLLIKFIDRLHNMQTIQFKSADKIQKIVNETLKSFFVFIMHTQQKELEKTMYKLCCKTLSINETTLYKPLQIRDETSDLFYSENTDIHQYVSQVFQNVISQVKN